MSDNNNGGNNGNGGGGNDDEPNPVRDIVYQRLGQMTESGIQRRFLDGAGPQMIAEITAGCQDAMSALGGTHDEKTGTFATVLLHYLLASLLIPSQRKVTVDETEIDIVIPDTRTLGTNWNSCLVLCILTGTDRPYVERRVSDARKVQPNRENIWIVSPKRIDVAHRTFVVGPGEGATFPCIIDRINGFLERNRSSMFRIFKAT